MAEDRRRRRPGHPRRLPEVSACRSGARSTALRRRRLGGGAVHDRHPGDDPAVGQRASAGFPCPRHRRLRRLLHGGGRLPGAGAHPQARRTHPRHADPRPHRAAHAACPGALEPCRGLLFAVLLAWFAARLVWQSFQFNDVSQGTDASRRCGFRSWAWPSAAASSPSRWPRNWWPSFAARSDTNENLAANRRGANRPWISRSPLP
jgi:hypothetical protein